MHPAGKKAISMDKEKYCVIEKAEATHKEILKTITEDFKKNKIKFTGSIEWHLDMITTDIQISSGLL